MGFVVFIILIRGDVGRLHVSAQMRDSPTTSDMINKKKTLAAFFLLVPGTGTPQAPLLISNCLWLLSLLLLTVQNRTIKLNDFSKRWPKGGQGFGVQVRLMYGLYVSGLLFVKVFKNNPITRKPDYYCV